LEIDFGGLAVEEALGDVEEEDAAGGVRVAAERDC
jgi:hypothetical protein